MDVVQQDFDRLARLDDSGWTHNNHYHNFLLRQLPLQLNNALELGCGTGAFTRLLAKRTAHVVGVDLSPEMIRVARSYASETRNVQYLAGDAMKCDFEPASFDCVVSIATLHHLSMREMLEKMKLWTNTGGKLLVLDLFDEARNISSFFRDAAAMGFSVSARLIRNGRLRPPAEVRAAWNAHGKHDAYPTFEYLHSLCDTILPNARLRKHLLWRYSIVWQKP
jgi:ubiquinone/menaquinone biosynthesis C-methylase UbiE